MKRFYFVLIFSLLCLYFFATVSYAQGTTFQRAIGGTGNDSINCIAKTNDGGYIAVGYTTSFGAGNADIYVLKYNSADILEWKKVIGGTGNDIGYSIIQTSDGGGYALTGTTNSTTSGNYDIFVVKLSSVGSIAWDTVSNLPGDDCGYSIIQTSDGYAITGYATMSYFCNPTTSKDVVFVKLSDTGSWSTPQLIGGCSDESGRSIIQSADNGYVIAGTTRSFGAGNADMYVIWLNSNGGLITTRTYGGNMNDIGNTIIKTTDGYAIAGTTYSYGSGTSDMYIVRLNNLKNVVWVKALGGNNVDYGESIIQENNGSFVIAGTSYITNFGLNTCLLKLSSNGTQVLWQGSAGDASTDIGKSVIRSNNGNYYIAGGTNNSSGNGNSDAYIVKFDNNGTTCNVDTPGVSINSSAYIQGTGGSASPYNGALTGANINFGLLSAGREKQICPGIPPASTWQYTVGTDSTESIQSIVKTSDGGFAAVGGTGYSKAVYMMKFDSDGGIEWTKTIAGSWSASGHSIIQTSDGGYAISGYTALPGVSPYIIKLSNQGAVQWAKTIQYFSYFEGFPTSICQSGDGGYVVVGTRYLQWSTYETFVIKLDENGDVEWTRIIGDQASNLMHSVVNTTDGGYAIAGSIYNSLSNFDDFYVVKLNSAGGPQWTRTIEAPKTAGLGISIIEDNNGDYVIAGTIGSGAYLEPSSDLYTFKLNSSGTIQWTSQVQLTSGANFSTDWFSDHIITQSSDNGYAIVGVLNGNSCCVVKLYNNGEPNWVRVVDGDFQHSSEGTSIAQINDGSYVVGGGYAYYAGARAECYIAKFDENGLTCNSSDFVYNYFTGGTPGTLDQIYSANFNSVNAEAYTSSIGTRTTICEEGGNNGKFTVRETPSLPVETGKLFIYPNPASTELWLSAPVSGNISIHIFDLLGQKVMSYNSIANKDLAPMHISIETLPTGIYQIVLEDSQMKYTSKFIKK